MSKWKLALVDVLIAIQLLFCVWRWRGGVRGVPCGGLQGGGGGAGVWWGLQGTVHAAISVRLRKG